MKVSQVIALLQDVLLNQGDIDVGVELIPDLNSAVPNISVTATASATQEKIA